MTLYGPTGLQQTSRGLKNPGISTSSTHNEYAVMNTAYFVFLPAHVNCRALLRKEFRLLGYPIIDRATRAGFSWVTQGAAAFIVSLLDKSVCLDGPVLNIGNLHASK